VSTDFLPGNRLDLLETGSEYFPALLAAIEQAGVEIRLETYIFENDITGHQIARALTRAAQRGVAVHVMVDGFGARGFMQHLGGDLLADGVEVLVYGPDVSPFTLRRHRLRRLHRKLVAIDARIAFVGGINIIDDMHTPRHIPPRHDYAVRIEGPMLAPIHASMRHLWQLVRWTSLPRRYKSAAWRSVTSIPCGEVAAAFLTRDNLRHRRDIEDGYLEAVLGAHREILLANAYFLPGRRFRHALIAAARRGVKVTILLQGQVEYMLLHYATHALYGALLSAGVHIHEYHKSFLHAKVAVIDGTWATVGSSNIDPFSLLLAREANVVVKNAAFAGNLLASMRRALESGAQEVRREDWTKYSLPARIASWLAYSVVRLMVGVAGYAQKGDPRHRKAGEDPTP